MKVDAWHLPWGRETVSHAILDINRGCNITCRACYNSRPRSIKSLDEIKAELAFLRTRRRLAYVSLVGGEVLLHPELNAIVQCLKDEGLCVQLFTNGVLLDERRLATFSKAGLEIIYLHIDRGQTRPDLPPNPTRAQVRELWDRKTSLIANHNIDVGMVMTAYAGGLDDVREMVEYVADSPHVNYLLVTLFRDTEAMAEIRGDIDSGMRGSYSGTPRERTDTLTNWDMIRYLREELGLRPFAYLGSNKSADDPRWLSYMLATRCGTNGQVTRYNPRASAFERLYCALSLRLAGKFPMYQKQSSPALVAQLLFNALMGGDLIGNLKFLLGACRPGGKLGAKRLLFQCPAQIEADGTVTHCLNCPDAVAKNGGLVPLCISDRVLSESARQAKTINF